MRAIAFPLILLAAVASADEPRVKARRGAVYVDGEAAWRGRRVDSPLVWSTSGDAVAFTGRDRAGRRTLVALVFSRDATPAALSWPIPRAAEPARAVTWLGPTRLGAGPTVLEPRVVASFTVLRSTP
jgi:hypothetical protein